MKTYDTIIIGSGGGFKLATALGRLGKHTALIEKDRTGGTCLNRGCIPSKMMIHPSGTRDKIRTWNKLHVQAEWHGADFQALTKSINDYTDGLSDQMGSGFEQHDHVDFYRGEAQFIGPKAVRVQEEDLTAETIIIATGSRPYIPAIPGLEGTPFMTSTDALRNRTLPPRLIVLGGGYIAAELGGAYAGFGSHVTYLLRSAFLRREDQDIQSHFTKHFSSGKTVYPHTRILRVSYENDLFTVDALGPEGTSLRVEAEALLVATGVQPNADQLGLEHTGVKMKSEGFIAVNEYLETSVPGIYAFGDVAGNYLFRHSVNFEVEYWIEANFLSEQPFPIVYPPVPSAVFTHPEIASVGMTEKQACKSDKSVVIGHALYPSCAMAVARGLDEGLVKLIFDESSGKLLGAHIIGEEASTMIQECVLALTHGMTMHDMYKQIYIHPAFPEVVRNAVRHALRQHDRKRAVLF
jgi:mycothione reductase